MPTANSGSVGRGKFSFLRELEDEECVLDLNEAMNSMFVQQDNLMGTLVKGKNIAKDFILKNPFLSAGALILALDAYEKYKNNQKYATKLFGKTGEEQKFYKKMVDDLVKSGKWKVIKDQNENGGRLWVMRRLHENDNTFVIQLEELKKNKAPLSPSECKIFTEAGCMDDNLIWRSVLNKQTVYVSETPKMYRMSTSIDEAIRNHTLVVGTTNKLKEISENEWVL